VQTCALPICSKPPAKAYPSTAATMGFFGGASVTPPNPRPSTVGKSPPRNAFRSMPAQNVPPAPVSTYTETSLRSSSSSRAAATPRAMAPLMAFLTFGRLSVMTAIPPSTSTRTSSDTATSGLLGLEADAAVQADDLGVDVVVLNQHPHQVGELRGTAHALGEHHRGHQLGLELLGVGGEAVDRGVDDAGADRVDPDADDGQVAGRGHGHADDAALGRRVGHLSYLALQGRNRRGVDDDTAGAVLVRGLGLADRGGADAHEVEGADQVDVDDLPVGGEVVRRAVPVHRTGGP